MSKKKIKVVWICHFTNKEIQSILPLWKKKNEFAPWIPNILKGFEKRDDVEIHVVSPHDYLKKDSSFNLRNIHYHFIPFGMPLWHRHWPRKLRFDIFTNFWSFRTKVEKLIDDIKPDIINLMGAENSYYSSSVLNLKNKYPVLVLIQGFISQFKDEPKMNSELKNRISIEENILTQFKYFCGEMDSSIYISSYNPLHEFFRLFFPVNEDLVSEIKNNGKTYDCIYFGRLENSKGAGDFIRVIGEIKISKQDVKACLIGDGNIDQYYKLAEELNCKDNIEFVGFVESQKELFNFVKSSKVFLAPPYKDRLSSTIREAMMLKVPIVAYATGGIPYINEFSENIYLVKTGDYKEMAAKALLLLDNVELADKLAAKAYNYCLQEFSLDVNTERFIDTYNSILKKISNTQ
jgi:glycosyltransferase involved in cell wall biosynthesis